MYNLRFINGEYWLFHYENSLLHPKSVRVNKKFNDFCSKNLDKEFDQTEFYILKTSIEDTRNVYDGGKITMIQDRYEAYFSNEQSN
jgi:hypothetical protein